MEGRPTLLVEMLLTTPTFQGRLQLQVERSADSALLLRINLLGSKIPNFSGLRGMSLYPRQSFIQLSPKLKILDRTLCNLVLASAGNKHKSDGSQCLSYILLGLQLVSIPLCTHYQHCHRGAGNGRGEMHMRLWWARLN